MTCRPAPIALRRAFRSSPVSPAWHGRSLSPRTPGDSNIQELSEERFVGALVYPVADPAGAALSVREREADPRVTPPGLAWRLVDDRHVEITRPKAPGFDRGAIYEFIYRARDPIVMGIGFAALRDIVSFLRYETKDNPLAPQERPRIRRALGFGISQSGRVLRDLVHLGFNQDLAGRQVFDGILPVVAGSRHTCVNWQFAQAAAIRASMRITHTATTSSRSAIRR